MKALLMLFFLMATSQLMAQNYPNVSVYVYPPPTVTYTNTPVPTWTPSPTFTAVFTSTASYTRTNSPTNTPVYTATGSLTPTYTNTSVFTATPTYTGSWIATATAANWTKTPTLTNTPIYTVTGSWTPTYTLTSVYTWTPTYTPTAIYTSTASRTFTTTPSITPSYTATPPGGNGQTLYYPSSSQAVTGVSSPVPVNAAVYNYGLQVNANADISGMTVQLQGSLDGGNSYPATIISLTSVGVAGAAGTTFSGVTYDHVRTNIVSWTATGTVTPVVLYKSVR